MSEIWIDTYRDFFICIDKLMELGKRAVKLTICHKSLEPNIGVFFDNDGLIRVEFYSYCLDLDDGGRHHLIESNDIDNVVDQLRDWVVMAKIEVKNMENDINDQSRI